MGVIRTAVLTAAVAVIGMPGVTTTLAETASTRPAAVAAAEERPKDLVEFVLPYSPYLFDLIVYAGRGLAEITHSGRRYDPVTGALVINGLELRRDGFAASVGQIRVSGEAAVYEDIAFDTRALPLDPTARAILTRLDREIVTGDVTVSGRTDMAAADYDVAVSLRIDGAGTLEMTAAVEGFHILAPLEDLGAGTGGAPEVTGRLRSARIAFTDAGLVSALYDVVGGQQGLTADQARATASMMAGIGVSALFSELPDGPSPRLAELARDWSATIQAFLIEPGRLEVSLDPATPFDLARLTRRGPGADEILALNPSVVSGASQRIALVDPATITLKPDASVEAVLPVAEALVEGRGVPQDIARGVALVLPAARSGNRAAIGLLARALALDPGVAIAQDQLRGAYVALLLAKADRLAVRDASLNALRRRLSPEELAAAEDEALQRWRLTNVGESQRRIEIGAFSARDWPTIRRLAFAYYEGATMPRNLMRAYGWASIAAAGGDRFAAGLRDKLTAAVSEGRIVLPMDRARKATDDLWRRMLSESPANPTTGDAGSGQSDENAPETGSPQSSASDTETRRGDGSATAAPADPSTDKTHAPPETGDGAAEAPAPTR